MTTPKQEPQEEIPPLVRFGGKFTEESVIANLRGKLREALATIQQKDEALATLKRELKSICEAYRKHYALEAGNIIPRLEELSK